MKIALIKNAILGFYLLHFVSIATAQEKQLTFRALNEGGRIDSVLVINLRSGEKIKLFGNESLTLKSVPTGLSTVEQNENELSIYPNPSRGMSTLVYYNWEKGSVFLQVYNNTGVQLGSYSGCLLPGQHKFDITFPQDGIYLISVRRDLKKDWVTAICNGSGNYHFDIVYSGIMGGVNDQNSLKSISEDKSIGYKEGDALLLTFHSGTMMSVVTEVPKVSKEVTVNLFQCTDASGQNYKTVKIGEQVWMAENLSFLPSVNSPTEGSTTDAHYYVYGYNGKIVNEAKSTVQYKDYGVLYNWPAAQTACPAGWHIPTDNEWKTLEAYLISAGYNYDSSIEANKIAKSLASTSHWNISEKAGAIGANLSLNNRSGFSALPGGQRTVNGIFNYLGMLGYWWASPEYSPTHAWDRYLYNDIYSITRDANQKGNGFSIRCIKD